MTRPRLRAFWVLTMATMVEAWSLYFDPLREFGGWLLYSVRERGAGKIGVATTSIPAPSQTAHVMTPEALANLLRVDRSTIYRLMRRGQLPGYRIGTEWRINAEEIERRRRERDPK